MNKKRWMTIALALVLAVAAVTIVTALAADEGTIVVTHYFYDQLTSDQRVFYDAMEKMYKEGTFKSGNESLELTGESGLMTEDVAKAYMSNGDSSRGSLLTDFAAARDAFYADYPDVFYVDFSALSVRATSSNGTYHIYIGPGKYETYYTEGFTSVTEVEDAVKKYEAAVGELVEGAKNVKVVEGQDKTAAMAGYVHDTLIRSVTYKLENACKEQNRGFIRTSYGALVCGEGVCEAYTRAFKSAMDRLGIPCVMVSGVYMHDKDTPEQHIWNYVCLDGEWYGVDATMDDPISPAKTGDGGVDGYENREYFLAGAGRMGNHHYPSGIMSASNYEFSYPALCFDDYGTEVDTDNGAFSVRVDYNGVDQDDHKDQATVFTVSYLGMGAQECVNNGYYMLQRYVTMDEETGEPVFYEWSYIIPDAFFFPGDSKESLTVSLSYNGFVQFAVTTKSPGTIFNNPLALIYKGQDSELLASTGVLRVSSNYKVPPYPKRSTPSMQSTLIINGTTYSMEIEFTDDLVRDDSGEVKIETECFYNEVKKGLDGDITKTRIDVPSGVETSRIYDIEWNEETPNTVRFKFRPSEMFAADSVYYTFHIKGLVGKESGKEPIELTYGADHPCAVCALKSQGWDWNVFGKPQLLDDQDLSMDEWKTADGEGVDEILSHRLTLVTTTTTESESDTMNDLIDGANGDEVVKKSETYNIKLTLCKKQIIHTGQSVYISLGFPEGYGPDDAGVTFKAYHFIKDEAGNTVGVEEIPCYVTEYGLIIEVKSFSPFAIAAVDTDSIAEEDKKEVVTNVMLTSSEGGHVDSEKGKMFTLDKDGKVTVNVTSDDGRVIDTLTVNGEEVKGFTAGAETYSFEITESMSTSLEGGNVKNITVNATFVSAKVREEEVKKGETVVLPPATPVHEHTWGDYITDDAGHYRKCKTCGATTSKAPHVETKHAPGDDETLPENCMEPTFKCEECSHTIPGAAQHALRTVQTADGTKHYQKCDNCKYTTDPVDHEYLPTLGHDENGHWKICHCGHSTAVEAHELEYKDAEDGTHYQVCKAAGCGYVTAIVEHRMSWNPTADGSKHEGVCACGATETGEHVYEDDKCTVCGMQKPAATPPDTGSDPSTDTTASDDTTAPGTTGGNPDGGQSNADAPQTGDSSIMTALSAILVVSVSGIVAVAVMSSKKKKI